MATTSGGEELRRRPGAAVVPRSCGEERRLREAVATSGDEELRRRSQGLMRMHAQSRADAARTRNQGRTVTELSGRMKPASATQPMARMQAASTFFTAVAVWPADKVHVVRLLRLQCLEKGKKARETRIINENKPKWAFNSNSASAQLKISILLHIQSILQNN